MAVRLDTAHMRDGERTVGREIINWQQGSGRARDLEHSARELTMHSKAGAEDSRCK